jgi:hypothetical protein
MKSSKKEQTVLVTVNDTKVIEPEDIIDNVYKVYNISKVSKLTK